jgi:hypothetical protein
MTEQSHDADTRSDDTSNTAGSSEFQEALLRLIRDYQIRDDRTHQEKPSFPGDTAAMADLEDAFRRGKEDLSVFFDSIMNTMNQFRSDWEAADTDSAGKGVISPQALADYTELMTFMGQAYLAWLSSGLRYWGRLSDIYGDYQQAMGQSLLEIQNDPASREQERRVLLDHARAYLREMASLPFQESRLLQAKLEKVARDMRWTDELGQPASPNSPRRLVRAKP